MNQAEERHDAHAGSGQAAAALLASGTGALTLGLLTVATQASTAVGDALSFSPKVGPLSGQAIVSAIVFFATWKGLGFLLRAREVRPKRVYIASAVMVGLGLLLTFPPVYQLF